MYQNSINFTGHRPDKLKGWTMEENLELIKKLDEIILAYIKHKGKKVFVTGMALGIDMWSALIVLKYKKEYPEIKLISAIPFKGQEEVFKYKDKQIYNTILSQADEIVYVCDEGYAPWKMQVRNVWMVDNCQEVLSVWDGTKGGTLNCINYAKKVYRTIHNINPNTLEFSVLNKPLIGQFEN